MKNKIQVELLSPAGSYESFLAAIHAGADAVYIGGSKFGARAYAENFTEEEILRAIDYAHLFGRKVFLTVNTLLKDDELEQLYNYLYPYYVQGLDAVIVQDIGVLSEIRRLFPELNVHASTQMTITGAEGAAFLEEQGVSRVVTARELSLEEIKNIKSRTNLEIESFVHGSLCYCYSGQCLLSSLLGGRSGNRGRCAQPCRLPYSVMQNQKSINGKAEQYVLSPKDMCTIDLIPELVTAGIDSLKIEGRMKKPEYTAGVTGIYRKYIDSYLENKEKPYRVLKEDRNMLLELYTRGGLSTGYYHKKNGRDMITLKKPGYTSDVSGAFEDVRKQFLQAEDKIPIRGSILLKEGSNMQLEAFLDEGQNVICIGDMLEKAKNQPTDKEKITKQLIKTGNTSFKFESIEVQIEGSPFADIKSLNELRRITLDSLMEKLLKPHRRQMEYREENAEAIPHKISQTISEISLDASEKTEEKLDFHSSIQLRAFVETKEVFNVLVNIPEIDSICLDGKLLQTEKGINKVQTVNSLIKESHAKGKQIFAAMPYIFREHTARAYELLPMDGYVVRNYEGYRWLLERNYKGHIIVDESLYTFNKEAEAFWKEAGALYTTVPFELNASELKKRGIQNSELVVYGYLPVMLSAQCIHSTVEGCRRHTEPFYLRDRYQKEFLVKNVCSECYNIIYNSVPLSLHGEEKGIKKLLPKSLRLQFTREEAKQAKAVAEYFIQKFKYGRETALPYSEFTKGHFRRGVE